MKVPGVGSLAVAHDLDAGAPATVVLRPEDAALVAAGKGDVTGSVADTYFLGGSSTVTIVVEGLERLVTATVHAAAMVGRGETLGVKFDLDRAVVVRGVPAG
ncbi:MAG: TOBE domain-containing protein [Schumannella sp.]